MISRIGTFPASGLNIGLAAAPAGIAVQIARLNAEIGKLTLATATQIEVAAAGPPNIPGYIASFGAALNPANLASIFNPTNWVTAGADGALSLAVDLGLVTGQIAALNAVTADIRTGLTAPGIFGWSYSGKASGFGTALDGQTSAGFGGVDPRRNVSAVIIATGDFSSWGSFSTGMDTGGSANEDIGSRPQSSRLAYHGARSGSGWSPGLQVAFGPLSTLELELQGAKAGIETQAQLAVGIGLPNPADVVAASLDVDLGAALQNFVNVQLDLGTQISGLNARIDALTELTADINASLSGGGLTVWSYSGPAGQLGSSFVPEVQGGLPGTGDGPNGPAYGLVLAGASPQAWASFGKIFKTS